MTRMHKAVIIIITAILVIGCLIHWLYNPTLIEGVPPEVDREVYRIRTSRGNCLDKAYAILDLLADYGETWLVISSVNPPGTGGHATVIFYNSVGRKYHVEPSSGTGGMKTVLATEFWRKKFAKGQRLSQQDWEEIAFAYDDFWGT